LSLDGNELTEEEKLGAEDIGVKWDPAFGPDLPAELSDEQAQVEGTSLSY